MTTAAIEARPARIVTLDIVRGFALLAMFIVHFNDRASGGGAWGSAAATFVLWFLDGKGYAIFATLFGVSFAILLHRAEAQGGAFLAPFLRRIGGIAILGLLAEAVFGYSVLISYAVWSLPLLLVRHWSTRALLVALLVCAMSQ